MILKSEEGIQSRHGRARHVCCFLVRVCCALIMLRSLWRVFLQVRDNVDGMVMDCRLLLEPNVVLNT